MFAVRTRRPSNERENFSAHGSVFSCLARSAQDCTENRRLVTPLPAVERALQLPRRATSRGPRNNGIEGEARGGEPIVAERRLFVRASTTPPVDASSKAVVVMRIATTKLW